MNLSKWTLAGLVVIAGLLVWFIVREQPMPSLDGRPLTDWVKEVEAEIEGVKHSANEVLYAAGPRIIPDLSRLLLQPESPWMARLPAAWIPERMIIRYDDQLRMKANAAWIISVIAYRNPNCAESQVAVSALTTALNSRNSRVRYISAQALGAIGTAASNAIPELALRTSDGSSSVRLCAVEALGRIGFRSTESIHAARSALSDTNNDVRFVATQALARLQK